MLTPWPVLPPSHGGRVRAFRLAAGLVRCGARVQIACPWAPGQPRGEHVREGVVIRPQLFAGLPLLALPDPWLPSALTLAWQARLQRARSLLGKAAEYDVVQVDSSGYAPWLERVPADVRRVYGSPNVEADFARGRVAHAGRLRRRLADRVADLERRGVNASDLVLACTQRDALRFEELYPTANCAVVPNGFDDALLSVDRAKLRATARAELGVGADERIVLFIGGGADHNQRAVAFLEQEVAPRLAPRSRLLIVGKAGDALSGGSNDAVAIEYAEDMRPLLAAADVAVNPVAYGSGSNLKVAEYLASGLPVVTTPIGARGFERWNAHMAVVELEHFPEAIDGAGAPGPPAAGIDELGWNRIAEHLYELYSS